MFIRCQNGDLINLANVSHIWIDKVGASWNLTASGSAEEHIIVKIDRREEADAWLTNLWDKLPDSIKSYIDFSKV